MEDSLVGVAREKDHFLMPTLATKTREAEPV
jgi:hypothetical protein